MPRITEEEFEAIMARMGKQAPKPQKKKSKYNARKVTVDGLRFDSELEAKFYGQLKLLQKVGAIDGFCRQARFIVTEGDTAGSATEYLCDFVIFYPDHTYKIVDTKGVQTEVFKLKMKSFHEKYPRLKVEIQK